MTISGVHAVRSRIKDAEHVAAKVMRKSPKRKVTLQNYRAQFDDLVGARAIHLYKGDWERIDKRIREPGSSCQKA